MAGALVSTLLEQFASIAVKEAKQEIKLVVGVDTEVRKFEGNLRIIQAVLDDAEKRQLKENAVKLWLEKLKDTFYEMDDVLDEWNTAMIKLDIEKNEEENAENEPIAKKRKVRSFFPSPSYFFGQKKRKLWSFFPSPSYFFGQFNKIVMRRDIAHKIKELSGNIDELFKERVGYGFELSSGTEVVERIKTTSLVDESAIVGRDKEGDALVRNLLGEGSEGERNPYVISLVGLGGIGKTTLAQLAYNHHEVQAHFEKTMWVCVSDPFDQCRVAKAILEGGGRSSNFNELQTLLEKICDLIRGKKILLVLDDVWTEETTDWEPFKLALKCGAQGSKILVTTRNERVARMVDSASMTNLNKLSEDDCWLIISKLAFFGKDEMQCEHLEDLGRKLANKCKGLPLATKTLGSLMRNKKSIQEWRSVLDNNLWELEDVQKGLLGPLLLSYYELPSAIKWCFIYCAVFPKDHLFSKNELVYLWMAQGFLDSKPNIEMEIIGEEYFEKLVMRSFFQFKKDCYNGKISYTMHDIVHDFAKAMTTTNEYFTIDNDKELGRNCESARHMSLKVGIITQCPMYAYNAKNLRTLLCLRSLFLQPDIILPNLFQQLTCLRALSLTGNIMKKLPDEVGKLIHLRFLDLSLNATFRELPETVCNLCNLQTLNVNNCGSLKKLPRGMGKLINLRHLIHEVLPYDGGLTEPFPKGIGKLSSLRTLNQFIIGGTNDSEGCKLGELKNLNHLTGYLKICGLGNVVDVQEAENAELKKKVHLHHLDLRFYGGVEENIRVENDELVLNALEPPPYLEILKNTGWKGIVYPNWIMSLTNLKSLLLNRCDNLEHFPSLGRLPFLKSLEIIHADSVKKVGVEFLGIESNNKKDKGSTSSLVLFPNLKSLKFSGLKEWEEWHGMVGTREEGGVTIMPHLQSLTILSCPKLKTLPNFLETTPLQELIMDALVTTSCNNFEHLPPLGKLRFLETLKIKNADIVKKVGVEFLGIESNNKKDKGSTSSPLTLFPNLKSLIFDSFGEWEEWDGIGGGGGGVTIMPRLESLSILNCPKLKALPNFLETTPLQDLRIDARISDWVTILTSTRLKELRLYVTGCINLEHLPPVGKLPFLEHLEVKNASSSREDSLKKEMGVKFWQIESYDKEKDEGSTSSSSSSSLVLFPNLKFLRFENLEVWEEWDAMGGTREEGGVTIMPRLQKLIILQCPKLKLLPDFLPTLQLKELKINLCPILVKRYGRQTGEEWSKISHIPTIEIDFYPMQIDGRNIPFPEIKVEL